jgi:exopolysaccharide production protein ExoY
MTLMFEQADCQSAFDCNGDYSAALITPAHDLKPSNEDVSFGFGGMPKSRPDANSYASLKRLFDVCFAASFLIVALPFLIILAIALQIDSPGKLFFVQDRIGLGGKRFKCIKFRTMRMDAEDVLKDLLANCPVARREWSEDHKLRVDPRVSGLGVLVRKLSLDELPQLVNILKGDMSVVGPRPIVRDEISKYGQLFKFYCAVKPGLTGLWQVSGRNDVTYDERVQMDRDYALKASFAFDMHIIAKTVPAVLGAKGAY